MHYIQDYTITAGRPPRAPNGYFLDDFFHLGLGLLPHAFAVYSVPSTADLK